MSARDDEYVLRRWDKMKYEEAGKEAKKGEECSLCVEKYMADVTRS